MGLNRFSYNHEEGIHVSNALSYAWRVFFYLNYFKVSNATLHCDNVAQAKIMMEVYRHFFIGTYLEGEHEPEFVQTLLLHKCSCSGRKLKQENLLGEFKPQTFLGESKF